MTFTKSEISIPVGNSFIYGDLSLVTNAHGFIIFAHGSGSSRLSSRNQFVAQILQQAGFSTFLFDLLTPEEERVDIHTREFRFNIPLLAERLVLVTHWIQKQKNIPAVPIGYFGASTGAAAALIAAAQLPHTIAAVVCRGGRPDLAQSFLPKVTAPTLLIVGAYDTDVIALNKQAYDQLMCEKNMKIVPGASHLFEEADTLEKAAHLTKDWFIEHLKSNKK
jgi:dienelactone hydrolase